MSILNAPHFHDEKAAYLFVEGRIWRNGRVCPHCGSVDNSNALKGASTRIGVYKCYDCRKPFTVKVGTIFESSKVAMHLWLQAIFLIASSKKGISSHQLHRTLGVTLKTAWFMSMRIREAMRDGALDPLGRDGVPVEADETYYGRVAEEKRRGARTTGTKYGHSKAGRGPANKRAIVSLVERGGRVRSFHVPTANKVTVTEIVRDNLSRETKLYTDESRLYGDAPLYVSGRETVKHSWGEYVRGDVHTNSVEGYFSIFKRGMRGIYQHCAEKHLHRYLSEFDFRYNHRIALGVNDVDRMASMLDGAIGKRLTYRAAGC